MWYKCHFGRNIAVRNSLGPNNQGKCTDCKFFNVHSVPGQCVTCSENDISGCFPFVRTVPPSLSSHNENFTFNQSYPARLVKSCSIHEGDGFWSKKYLEKAYFVLKITGLAMIWPASSDFWKAPLTPYY